MKPLIVLISSFLLTVILVKFINKEYRFLFAARIAMSIMLCFTALGHFIFSKGMSMMVPSVVPFKLSIVYFTGVFEVIIAIGLHIPKIKMISGWVLILFLLLMLPANIYASINNINYQNATFDGKGVQYLWFRIPLQIFFIFWVYTCSIRTFNEPFQ